MKECQGESENVFAGSKLVAPQSRTQHTLGAAAAHNIHVSGRVSTLGRACIGSRVSTASSRGTHINDLRR